MAQSRHPISNNSLSLRHRLGPMNLRGALGLMVVIVIVGLVGWVYLSHASEAAETVRRVQELRQQREELLRQNDQLAYEVARLASVKRLGKRARELGYVAVWQARFLAVAGYPAQDDATFDGESALTRSDPRKRATPSAVAGWWEAVTDQFEDWAHTENP